MERFFYYMTNNALQYQPPLTFFRNFRTFTQGSQQVFDLKKTMAPLVDLVRVYALKHQIFKTNTGERLWKLSAIGLVLLALEMRGVRFERGILWPLGALVRLFSRQSLIAYVAHLILLFGYWKFRPLNRWLFSVDWPAYVLLASVVVAGTVAICMAADAWSAWRGRVRQARQPSAASSPA